MDCNVAENINILAKFLGTRDIDALNQEELFKRYGIHQVDVMVLFGGSILEGGDVLASGIKNFVAKNILLLVEQDIQQIHCVRLFIQNIRILRQQIYQKQKYFKSILNMYMDARRTIQKQSLQIVAIILRIFWIY